MNFRQIIQNPWTKRIGIAAPIIIGGIVIVKKQQEKNQWNKIKSESNTTSTNTQSNQVVQTSKPAIDNTIDLRSENGIQYNSNTLVIGSNRYQFSMPGVKKLQVYLSKASQIAARHISMSGGTDGIIGRGFIKALAAYVKEFSGTKSRAYSELMKNSGLKSNEVNKA